VDSLQIVAYVVFAAVAACTLLNLYTAVASVRSVGRVTHIELRTVVWCTLAALVGFTLLLLTLAG
jgi:hypothetical protein